MNEIHTHTQSDYCNPRAHVPSVNKKCVDWNTEGKEDNTIGYNYLLDWELPSYSETAGTGHQQVSEPAAMKMV